MQQVCKAVHGRCDPDTLRADLFAAMAGDAGGGLLLGGEGGELAADILLRDLSVVKRKKRGDVKCFRALFHAVAAARTGDRRAARQLLRHIEQCVPFGGGEGLRLRHRCNVILQLLKIRHPREHHANAVDALQKAEGPRGNALVRVQGTELFLRAFVERGEPSAAHRLHHPDGDAALAQERYLVLCALEGPVHVVELDLAELGRGKGVQKALHGRKASVRRKAEVPDAPRLLLLAEKVDDAVSGVKVTVNVAVAHAVEEVEIEVVHPAALELGRKNFLGLGEVLREIAGELCGKIVRFARVFTQNAAHHRFGSSLVIGPGGVVIVHAARHRAAHDGFCLRLVDLSVVAVQNGKAHTAETQRGKLDILEFFV